MNTGTKILFSALGVCLVVVVLVGTLVKIPGQPTPPAPPDNAEIARQQARVAADNAEADAKRLRGEVPGSPNERKAFADKLRDFYLDRSENIHVTVSGKSNEIITLSYILIGDVWIHHFFKDASNLATLQKVGFKTLILTDKTYWWKFNVANGENTSGGWYDHGRMVGK